MAQGRPQLLYLLMLAILLLPWQSLYAQSQMSSSPAQDHKCAHMQMEQHQDASQAMDCCDEHDGQCNSACGDCFHCQSFSAVIAELRLDFDLLYSSLISPLCNNASSLPPAAQFRPPRSFV